MKGFVVLLIGACSSLIPSEQISAQAPIEPVAWLTAQQFVDARFAGTVDQMRPKVIQQLKGTYPNVDWDKTTITIGTSGAPLLSFDDISWKRVSQAGEKEAVRASWEAYFNCTSQQEEREVTNVDVRSSEQEQTKKDTETETTKQTASVSIKSNAPVGGLGGEASASFEKTIQQSHEWSEREKEITSNQQTLQSKFTIPPLRLRLRENYARPVNDVYKVSSNARVDVPIEAVNAVTYNQTVIVRILGGNIPITVQKTRYDHYPLGFWSTYYPAAPRTIKHSEEVHVIGTENIGGNSEALFKTSAACATALKDLAEHRTTVDKLVRKVKAVSLAQTK